MTSSLSWASSNDATGVVDCQVLVVEPNKTAQRLAALGLESAVQSLSSYGHGMPAGHSRYSVRDQQDTYQGAKYGVVVSLRTWSKGCEESIGLPVQFTEECE